MELETALLFCKLMLGPRPQLARGQTTKGATMKLNHPDLQVSDIHAARAFFEMHFGLHCSYTRRDEIALLEDDAGFSLAVSNLFKNAAPVYPPDFHVGFVLEDAAQVEAIYEQLKSAGVSIKHDLAKGGPNLFFMCVGPDGIPVEVRAPRSKP
jgi:catechol 2,3-dioxygenase-like lactoylglutathione lyase family enzyme